MKANGLVDPGMPAQELRLHMGEMSAQELRTARAAIRWANARALDRITALEAGGDLRRYEKCKDLSKQGWSALSDARLFLNLGTDFDVEEAKQCIDLAQASFADTIISSENRAANAEFELKCVRELASDDADEFRRLSREAEARIAVLEAALKQKP